MSQQQLQTPVSLHGNHPTGMSQTGIDSQDSLVEFLDRSVPLHGASHANVVEYCVEAPMCYARCVALLASGEKVGLNNPWQFVGWSDDSLLFRSNGKHFEVAIESDSQRHAPGALRVIFLEDRAERRTSFASRFIGIDGDLVKLAATA